MGTLTVLAVFAHPDDEAFGTGGTLAKYAAEGVDVYLVTATRGEAGQIALPALATPASLPAVRERELRCACQTYGIHPPIFLDYVDGQLPIVHQGQAVGKLVKLIRQLRPQVLITFGPDGIYGHYDHLAVHRWATIAYDLAADPECFPDRDACQPHQVSKLYFRVIPQEALDARSPDGRPAAVMMDGVPFPFVGYPASEITTVIDVAGFVEPKRQGILCHATQVGDASRYATAADEVLADRWFRQETFRLARSTVGWPDGVEDDLFARLR
jgi:LmbE family N-acetylglucosaminyl deacetylase